MNKSCSVQYVVGADAIEFAPPAALVPQNDPPLEDEYDHPDPFTCFFISVRSGSVVERSLVNLLSNVVQFVDSYSMVEYYRFEDHADDHDL
jgi:hypothetical protein